MNWASEYPGAQKAADRSDRRYVVDFKGEIACLTILNCESQCFSECVVHAKGCRLRSFVGKWRFDCCSC